MAFEGVNKNGARHIGGRKDVVDIAGWWSLDLLHGRSLGTRYGGGSHKGIVAAVGLDARCRFRNSRRKVHVESPKQNMLRGLEGLEKLVLRRYSDTKCSRGGVRTRS